MIRRFLPRLRLFKSFYSSPVLPLSARSQISASRPSNSRLFTHFSARLTSPTRSPLDDRPLLPENATLSQRLKHLIKSYGWYALGMYAVLTVVDFGIAFAGVNLLGAEFLAAAIDVVPQTPLEDVMIARADADRVHKVAGAEKAV